MDRREKERLDIHILHNPFPKAFGFLWDSERYVIPANGQLPAVYGVAVHGANRLVEKMIESKEGYTHINERKLRIKYLNQVVPTIDPLDIIGDPLKVEEIKTEEGFVNEEVKTTPNIVVNNMSEGFAEEKNIQAEVDSEIDLNPVLPNEEEIPSEEELRKEALKDSLPTIAREEELNKLDYLTELKQLASSLSINPNQKKTELIQQIIDKENK